MTPLLTPEDLARLFSVEVTTIRQWTREGILPPPVRPTARTLRWPRESISDLLTNFGLPAAPGHPGAVSGSER